MEIDAVKIIERMLIATDCKNPAELARLLQTGPATVANWKKRNMAPYKEIYNISRQFGYSMDWILTGKGESKEGKIQVVSEDEGYFHVPQYSIEASAGQGTLIEAETIDQHLSFKESWLRRSGINPTDLIAMYARGDSMEPTIYSGDSLVIDKTMNSVTSDGGIYVINYDGELFVKRVQKQLNGTVAITSDNKNYGDIVIPSSDLNTLRIIGRVVWSGHPMI